MARLGSAGTHVTVALDRASPRPLTEQIACGLRDAVAAGRLRPGTRLPSTRALARDWDVSRNTVLHVFERLVDEGLLESRVGAGTYVRSVPEPAPTAGPQEAPPTTPPPDYPFRSLSRRGRTLIDQNVAIHENPAAFMPDVPDPRAFPMRSLLRLMNEVTGRLKGHILVSVANAGYQPLRAAIAHHLRATRQVDCEAADIIITTGSQQSLDLVSRLLLEPGDPVWLEEPGYIGARAALKANGCALHPCRVDAQGLDVETGRAQLPVPRMVFVSASRHYPLGVQLSQARRKSLLDYSRACGAWILEDDYDCEFRYDGPVSPALKSEDSANRVILIGTFSKTLLPSFRLGYIVAPPDLRDAFARARAVIDRHAPILEQMVLAEFMQRGFYAAHLRN
ncbi:MAG: PLP-dependent aminotransferase family protein, partial [Pseudomonadota bacterium]